MVKSSGKYMAIAGDMEEIIPDLNLEKEKQKKALARPQSAHSLPVRKIASPGNSPTSINENLQIYRNLVSKERWKELKRMSETVIKEKKVFLIKGGGFSAIRRALVARGWIQKFDSPKAYATNLNAVTNDLPSQDQAQKNLSEADKLSKTKCEKLIMHKLLENQPVDFLWTSKRDKLDWLLVKPDVLISRFSRATFTSKEGLCQSINQMHWYTEPGVSYTCFPRCYNIHMQEQLDEFVDDFRLTACMGLLKWMVNTYDLQGEDGLCIASGKIPVSAIEFAITRLTEYLGFVTHRDIDDFEDIVLHVWEYEWDHFLTHHYLVLHENDKFYNDSEVVFSDYYQRAERLLKALRKHCPQMDLDGVMNIWIVKPGNKCRGRGIHLMNNIKEIVAIANSTVANKARFVVQKYIENPLVVYNTKFDIRQWFLITSSQPLTIWMYKDSYLRFSSQLFNLTNYHESVHLTNNAVQSRYKNNDERDKALPDENMWDCHTFKTYLRQIGKADLWEEKIYPGMRECLIGSMLASQDSMDRRQNSFELYGADFMLTDDFTPWLIEINSSPDLAHTTSVTARLCPQCLEDIIKVVVDTKLDPDADTGMFELAYKQVVPKAPAYLGLTLSISGKRIFKKKKIERPTKHERHLTPSQALEPLIQYTTQIKQKSDTLDESVPEGYSGPIITDLMTWLKPPSADRILVKDAELENKESLESVNIQEPLTIVKSGLLVKSSGKTKRKSKHFQKRERQHHKSKNKSPTFCCKLEDEPSLPIKESFKEIAKNIKQPEKAVEKVYWQDPKQSKSVGNKRCYIEPTAWDRDTASILRSTSTSVLQPNEVKAEPKGVFQVTPRIFSPGIISFNKLYPKLKKAANGATFIDFEPSKDSIGISTKRHKHSKRENARKENQSTI